MLKGADRSAVDNAGNNCISMIKADVSEPLKRELESILKPPVYSELCMVGRVPLKPLKRNHKTQIVFIVALSIVLACQFLVVLPN